MRKAKVHKLKNKKRGIKKNGSFRRQVKESRHRPRWGPQSWDSGGGVLRGGRACHGVRVSRLRCLAAPDPQQAVQ